MFALDCISPIPLSPAIFFLSRSLLGTLICSRPENVPPDLSRFSKEEARTAAVRDMIALSTRLTLPLRGCFKRANLYQGEQTCEGAARRAGSGATKNLLKNTGANPSAANPRSVGFRLTCLREFQSPGRLDRCVGSRVCWAQTSLLVRLRTDERSTLGRRVLVRM